MTAVTIRRRTAAPALVNHLVLPVADLCGYSQDMDLPLYKFALLPHLLLHSCRLLLRSKLWIPSGRADAFFVSASGWAAAPIGEIALLLRRRWFDSRAPSQPPHVPVSQGVRALFPANSRVASWFLACSSNAWSLLKVTKAVFKAPAATATLLTRPLCGQ